MTLSAYDDVCPLITRYTREIGIPDELLIKLYRLRQWRIPEDGPIPFKWPTRLRPTIWDVIRERDTGIILEPKQYQLQMAQTMSRMPRFINGDSVGLGKAQPLTARILTPTGWASMGEMALGREVIDPDGGIAHVVGVYPQGERDVFEVETTDGEITECCAEHLWTIQTAGDRHGKENRWRTWTTKQLIDYGLHRKGGKWNVSRIFLPLTKPVEFTSLGPLPIPAYSMGALLGDGGVRSDVSFTNIDSEILAEIQRDLPRNLALKPRKRDANTYGISKANGKTGGNNPYLTTMKRLGLFGGYSYEKFIPCEYLRAPIEDRIALVQGLMDTDGECAKSGLAYFHTTSVALKNDFSDLVRSLGGFTRISKSGPGKYRRADGVIKECRHAWTLTVQTPFNPFRVARKRNRWKQPLLARAIKAIRPLGTKPVQCIRVTSKRNLYVTDGHIVTHNTLESIISHCWLSDRLPGLKIIVFTTKSTTGQWADEYRRFSTLRPYVMQDKYKGKKSYEARFAQLQDFLTGSDHEVLVVKYSSMIGKRKKVEGEFDEDGFKVAPDGKERIASEIKQFLKILQPHGPNILMVLDECQKFKTIGGSTRNMVQILSRPCSRVHALTATIIKNGLDEMYSIASAIGIRPFGYPAEFADEFCIFRKMHVGKGRHKEVLQGYRNVAKFKQGMRPFFLGRSQRQVKEKLPRLSTLIHPIDLDDEQARLLLEDIPSGRFQLPPAIFKQHGEIVTRDRDPENEMTMLSVYQLVANHPGLLDPANQKGFLTKSLSPKEEALLDMLDGDFRGEKVIVYTKSKTWIDRLEWLTKNGAFTGRKFLRITGDENETERNQAKRLFQDPEGDHDLIVINAAATEGVNLQQAAHMILLDLPWSWGDLMQLVGRMVRMASPHSACTLHVFVGRGTVDEYAVETLKGKKGLFEKILGESHSAGLLDDREVFDLDSGMEQAAKDSEFLDLMKAHVKGVSLSSFIKGDQLSEAQNDEGYKMAFEKGAKKKKPKSAVPDDLDEQMSKWGI